MLQPLLAFLRNPTDHLAPPTSTGTRVRALLLLLAVDLGIALLLGGLIGLISESGLVDLENHAVADALAEFSTWQLLLIAVLATPLIEELIFRFPLRYQANPVVGLARLFTPETQPETDDVLHERRRAGWDRSYHLIFYGFTLAFAFIHLMNYPDWSLGLLIVSPILVAPQFVMGAMAGFLRVRFGFVWAFALHALHNLVLVGLALLAPEELLDAATDPELLEGFLGLIPAL